MSPMQEKRALTAARDEGTQPLDFRSVSNDQPPAHGAQAILDISDSRTPRTVDRT